MKEMRLIVVGGTDFEDVDAFNNTVIPVVSTYREHGYNVTLVTGGTKVGVNGMAYQLANEYDCQVEPIPAKKGKGAMVRRNVAIINYAGRAIANGGTCACIAFYNGNYKPVAHLVQMAMNENIPVTVVDYESTPQHIAKENVSWKTDNCTPTTYDSYMDRAIYEN